MLSGRNTTATLVALVEGFKSLALVHFCWTRPWTLELAASSER